MLTTMTQLGTRLFPEDGPDIALDAVAARRHSPGVAIETYRPAGRPQYATALTSPAARRRGESGMRYLVSVCDRKIEVRPFA